MCIKTLVYESVSTVDMLAGAADIWLPDLKTAQSALSQALFGIRDYGKTAKAAIKRMIELSPLRFTQFSDKSEKIVSGVIVRHLVLPGCMDNTQMNLGGPSSPGLSDRLRSPFFKAPAVDRKSVV